VVLTGFTLPDCKFGQGGQYNFGRCWFVYGEQVTGTQEYNGRIQFINWQYNVFFPENPNAIAFQWQAKQGVTARAYTFTAPAPAAITVAGQVINPLAGALANFHGT
jgi:hypothetical protein